MNAKTLIAIASVAAAFSGFARAGEASDMIVTPDQLHGTRTRAEVQAEAVQAAKSPSLGEASTTATGASAGIRDAQAVKAEAVQASRFIRVGEAS
ncbi:DUF4148 domain-containing protein [Ramlibacter humi]|uniref:DUF4148 domain-containing protein n=1 Tax=Ramlibacter humi TaxID=2530451 RepID=A0A4Z0BFL3_9BURK|nr:DUF4148 domain-containing protein [Ramlibacter humi]TFY97097.1 DUF4148 domain-containing protein [Ramlibacter humi]